MTTLTTTQILTDIIQEAEMRDENNCPCCLPLISVEIDATQLEELVYLLRPNLLPLLKTRLETVTRKF